MHRCRGYQKKPSVVKKGLEDGRSLLEGQEVRRGHFKPFSLLAMPMQGTRRFFSRMQGTWLRQVPRILEKKSKTALHRHCELGKKGSKYHF